MKLINVSKFQPTLYFISFFSLVDFFLAYQEKPKIAPLMLCGN